MVYEIRRLDFFGNQKDCPMQKMYSVHEASLMLGYSKQGISKYIKDRTLPAVKIGSQWAISEQDLNEFMNSHNIIMAPKDHARRSKEIPPITCLSFFSGALGLDYGMELAGLSAILACESEKKCRMTIEANRPDVALIGDINNYNGNEIKEMAGIPKEHPIDVVFGGPPCQAFSTAGMQKSFHDSRGNVFLKFLDIVDELDPRYVVIENVRGLLSAKWPIKKGGEPIKGGAMETILKRLENSGYAISFNLYNAANFGAPQIRERVVIIGKKGDRKVPYLSPTHSSNPEHGLKPWVTFGEAIAGIEDIDHHHIEFPEARLRYYRLLKEGQYWKNLPPNMHEAALGKSFRLPGGKTGFYRRISYAKPCPTLVTNPAMPATDLCHPTENRPLSIEEYRRVQGFPDTWKFCGNILDIYRQIGNAVPVELGKAIGRTIMNDINNKKSDAPKNFRYSRYRLTDDDAWRKSFEQEKLKNFSA